MREQINFCVFIVPYLNPNQTYLQSKRSFETFCRGLIFQHANQFRNSNQFYDCETREVIETAARIKNSETRITQICYSKSKTKIILILEVCDKTTYINLDNFEFIFIEEQLTKNSRNLLCFEKLRKIKLRETKCVNFRLEITKLSK